MFHTATPDSLSAVAAILARGYLRYRRSRRFQQLEAPENDLASAPEPSRHVTVVNAERTDEK
jgi:hypothetical protein